MSPVFSNQQTDTVWCKPICSLLSYFTELQLSFRDRIKKNFHWSIGVCLSQTVFFHSFWASLTKCTLHMRSEKNSPWKFLEIPPVHYIMTSLDAISMHLLVQTRLIPSPMQAYHNSGQRGTNYERLGSGSLQTKIILSMSTVHINRISFLLCALNNLFCCWLKHKSFNLQMPVARYKTQFNEPPETKTTQSAYHDASHVMRFGKFSVRHTNSAIV